MEKYELVKDIGFGNGTVARLLRHKNTKQLVAVKFIPRGDKIDENVPREIINHRSLLHPNIIRFKEVFLTPTHLAIVMEYASSGDLFDRVSNGGRLSEDEARYFFRQLISGVSYCHDMGICHRDLKLENILLDVNPAQCLKICDFGLSKSYLLHSRPNSTVGSPGYIAPEVLSCGYSEYDGKLADVWSSGVVLYVMLVGAMPFEVQEDPQNIKKTVDRIMAVQYNIPSNVHISQCCRHLLSRIFVANPAKRITMKEIKSHPWFLKNLPRELTEEAQAVYHGKENATFSLQSIEEITNIVKEAKTLPGAKKEGMEKHELLKDIGFGDHAVARHLCHKHTKQQPVAVKCIPRGHKIKERVEREIINHRSVRHPNIIRFKEFRLAGKGPGLSSAQKGRVVECATPHEKSATTFCHCRKLNGFKKIEIKKREGP